jgi:hypothetical protein
MTTLANRGRWNTEVTIIIHDQSHNILSGASVYFLWSDGVVATCTTGLDGTCTVKRNNLKSTVLSLTLSVTDVALTGYEYDPTANEETSITIYKPE